MSVGCCCGTCGQGMSAEWVTGYLETPVGRVPRAAGPHLLLRLSAERSSSAGLGLAGGFSAAAGAGGGNQCHVLGA